MKPLNLITFLICLLLICLSSVSVFSSTPVHWQMTMENGMELIIIEDHSSPLVASVVNIRAGSHTETIPVNGISHLLEHLLFDGTKTRKAADIQSSIESRGGYINAFTRKDYVSFEVVMPTQDFEYGLEVQADQLLNSIIPEDELSRERRVVCEEIATDIQSSNSAVDDVLWETLFGKTGYGLPVIGNYQTVMNVSRERILDFYKTRYVPNRMTMIVIGDVQPAAVVDTVQRLYEVADRGLSSSNIKNLPDFPENSVLKVVPRPVKTESIIFALPAPAPDDPAFELFCLGVSLWSENADSPLQRAMDQLSVRTGAYVSPHNGFSLLQIAVSPQNFSDPMGWLKEAETAIKESIQTFLHQQLTEEMLQPLIHSRRVDHEFAKEKFHHLAREIGEHAALGSLDQYWNRIINLKKITPNDIVAAFNMWLSDAPGVGIAVVPDIEAGDDEVDLSQPVVKTLSNGLTVIAQYDSYADMVAMHLLTQNPGTKVQGVPRMVAELLDDGTETKTALELERALNRYGIRTKLADWAWLPFDDYYDSTEYNYLRMECLSEDVEVAVNLLAEMAFKSILPDEAVKKTKTSMQMLSGRNANSSSAKAKHALKQAVFKNVFHQQNRLPDFKDLAGIDSATLRNYYKSAYKPSNSVISVVSNVLPGQLIPLIETAMSNIPSSESAEEIQPELNNPQRVFVEVDNPMAYMRATLPVEINRENIAAWAVTSEFLSNALQEEIRAKRGKSYRLGAWLNERKGLAFLEIGVGTREENLQEIEAVVRSIVDGISELKPDGEMVSDTVNSLVGHELRYRQRRINRAYYLGWRYWMNHGIDFELNYIDTLKKVDQDTVTNLIQTIKSSNEWYWAVAARKDTQ